MFPLKVLIILPLILQEHRQIVFILFVFVPLLIFLDPGNQCVFSKTYLVFSDLSKFILLSFFVQ